MHIMSVRGRSNPASTTLIAMSGAGRNTAPSSGRALIGSGIGLAVFAVIVGITLLTVGDEPLSWRSALSPLVAILGIPVGVGLIVAGARKIARGER